MNASHRIIDNILPTLNLLGTFLSKIILDNIGFVCAVVFLLNVILETLITRYIHV